MREPNQGLVREDAVPSWLSRPGDRLAVYASAVGLERWARIAAVAITPLLLAEGGLTTGLVPLAGLAAYVLLTSLLPRNRYLRAADLLAAAALIAVAGDQIVAFLPFLLVAVAGPAAHGGLPAGILAGTVLSLLAVVRLAIDDELAVTGVAGVLPLTLLLVLTGITTAIAAQVRRDQAVRDRLTLQHAHRILGELRDLSADLPGGLDDRSIAQATLAEVERLPGAAVAVALGPDHGQLRSLATFGTGGRSPRPVPQGDLSTLLADPRRPRSVAELPNGLFEGVEEPDPDLRWLVQPLDEHSPSYLLLVGFRPPEPVAGTRGRLATIVEDARIALDNARLFDDTHRLAQHAARRRVAGELHDGVAQSLTHLRMELELLASDAGDDAQAGELARLARVARTALEDLRGTIADLRAPGGDLGGMIERYLDDVRTPRGPRIEVDRQPGIEVSPDQADQAMRAVQEAVSNALQHAEATTVEVGLRRDVEHVRLWIRDDGRGGVVGMPPGPTQDGHGVGLASLHDRAERLDGQLEISEPDGGGTQVTLTFPLELDTSGAPFDPGRDGTGLPPAPAARPVPDRGAASTQEEHR